MTNTFEQLGIEKQIIQAIEEQGFQTPMPVQEQVIPLLLQPEFKDIIALAQTGTGKTAAFGLPIIQRIDLSKRYIQYLILSPTRELCLQIADDLLGFAKYKNEVKVAAVFGGASIERQITLIKKGAHVISATPGRLLDLINRGIVDISRIKTIVLDEADEMLNMGFRDELEAILNETPKEKNTLLFSATMPNEVRAIASSYMHDPVEVTVGRKNSGAENVNHICYMVHARDRYLALKRIADYNPDIYGIIFCRTRVETQEVADQLLKDGYNAEPLHGDLSQAQRDNVMSKFRNKHLHLLVATDVAARGLDVDDLTHIINYNLPEELELYIHRSGRTGRAGKSGTSIVIANLKEKYKLVQIEKKLNKKFKYELVPGGHEICEKQILFLVDKLEKVEVDDTNIKSFLPDIYRKLEWLDREELIKKFVSVEFNRFLDYYKNSADLNVPIEGRSEGRSTGKRGRTVEGFTRFFINLGRTDNLKPAALMGMISDFTGINNIEIGDIEILQNFSFFEVDKAYTDHLIVAFKNQKLNERKISLEVAESKSRRKDGDHSGDKRRDRKPAPRNDYRGSSYSQGERRTGGSGPKRAEFQKSFTEVWTDPDARPARGRSEDRNRKSEYGNRKSEFGSRREGGNRKSESSGRSEGRSRRDDRSQKPEFRDRKEKKKK